MTKPKEKDGITKYNVTRRVSVCVMNLGVPWLTTAAAHPS
jgi:hypothetical protein